MVFLMKWWLNTMLKGLVLRLFSLRQWPGVKEEGHPPDRETFTLKNKPRVGKKWQTESMPTMAEFLFKLITQVEQLTAKKPRDLRFGHHLQSVAVKKWDILEVNKHPYLIKWLLNKLKKPKTNSDRAWDLLRRLVLTEFNFRELMAILLTNF